LEKRRDRFRQRTRALIGAACVAGAAQACELPPGVRVESERLVLSYRTVPARIAIGEHFELLFGVCPKKGFRVAGEVRADAGMPEHRHGMNYRPSITPLGAGRYRSEGWLLHMPGRWEFAFEIGGERLTHSVQVE
jgi:hypothetical protein